MELKPCFYLELTTGCHFTSDVTRPEAEKEQPEGLMTFPSQALSLSPDRDTVTSHRASKSVNHIDFDRLLLSIVNVILSRMGLNRSEQDRTEHTPTGVVLSDYFLS
jgi:hypothetical protein